MAAPSTLYRFRIFLSHAPDSELIDMRVAQHSSETLIFMITRVLAYAQNYAPGIQMGPGLHEPDAAALTVTGNQGQILKWIDIGIPSARRLHKSSKAAAQVLIYTHREVARLKEEVKGEKIYNPEKIQIFHLKESFLDELAELITRDNRWRIHCSTDEIEVEIAGDSVNGEIEIHTL